MASLSSDMHLDDSSLLHLVDGDASAWETDQWTKHVLGCAECSDRLAILRRRTDRLTHLLADIELPADFRIPQLPASGRRPSVSRRSGRPIWSMGSVRAAAVIVLLAAPFVLVEPLRALVADWVTDRWSQVAALFGDRSEPAPPASETTAEAESGSTLWFTPAGAVFSIELASRQSAGELDLRGAEGTEGSIEVVGGGAGEVPVLTESSLRVQNSTRSTADYRVSLPAAVERVEIRIADAPPVVLTREEIRAGRRISLSR
jgi:hypothetical protein